MEARSQSSRYLNQVVLVLLLIRTYECMHKLKFLGIQVVDLDISYRERVQRYQIHNYMYGQRIELPPGAQGDSLGGEALSDFRLSPISTTINFKDLTIYRIGGGEST